MLKFLLAAVAALFVITACAPQPEACKNQIVEVPNSNVVSVVYASKECRVEALGDQRGGGSHDDDSGDGE